jgi:hypothetical protein
MLVTTPSRSVRVRAAKPKTRTPTRLSDPIPTRWSLAGLIALVGANVGAAILEPLPANPEQPDPWFITSLDTIALVAMLAALGGLLARRRWGLATSSLGGAIAVVMVLGCPLSGHHRFGLWWAGEIACVAAWTAVSLTGARHAPSRRLPEPPHHPTAQRPIP